MSGAPAPSGHRWRLLAAAAVIGLAVGCLAAYVAHDARLRDATRIAEVLVQRLETDGFRYEYHVPTGTQSLFDLRSDPSARVNVIRSHEEQARRMRRMLEEKLGVPSLEDLRARYAEPIERLHALGYL